MKPFEPLLNASQAATLLDLHPGTLLRWVREGRFPHHRVGRKVRFRVSEIDAWLSSYNCGTSRVAPN